MIKPRYFSVNYILGNWRGFLFVAAVSTATMVIHPRLSVAQSSVKTPSHVWILSFVSDSLRISKQIPESNLEESLYRVAWQYGYFRSSLQSHEVSRDTLYAVFSTDGRYKWSDYPVVWLSDDAGATTIEPCALSGSWFDETDLSHCLQYTSDALVRRGYMQPTFVLDSLVLDHFSRSVTAIYTVKKGDLAILSNIHWVGLSKTRSQWLEKVAGLNAGMVLDDSNIGRVTNRLIQTNLFDEVSDPEVINNAGAWGLMYSVMERPLTFFDLIVGYVPNPSGDATIAGSGSLQIRNAGFDGTDVRIVVDRQSPRVGKMNITIDQHLLFGFPIGLNGLFSLARQDTLWQNRSATVGIWWAVHDNIRISAALNREVSASSKSSSGSADQWGTYGQIGLAYDSRDNIDRTSSGVFADVLVESGRQIVKPNDEVRFNQNRRKVRSSLEVHLPISGRNIIIPSLMAGTILTKRSPYLNELWRIGGAKSLRGYREDQFFAKSYLWGNIEHRFMLDPQSYLFAFGSAGWLWLPISDVSIGETVRNRVNSFGMGIAFRTNLGLLKLTYAKSPEDPFSNAKVHVGISSEF